MNTLGESFQRVGLLRRLVARELAERYQGSVLGWIWLILTPLLLLLVFTFVFSVVFQSRWAGASDVSRVEFALRLFAGLSVFTFFSECITRAPDLIYNKKNYVKEVVFPLQLLPLVAVLSSVAGLVISLLLLIGFAVVMGYPLTVSLISLPIVLVALLFLTLGICWFLSALGVYLRDTGQVVGPFTQMLLFLSPVFYPLSALPEKFHAVAYANPLVFPIEVFRGALFAGISPDWRSVFLYAAVAAAVSVLGYCWFQLTRRGFADVL